MSRLRFQHVFLLLMAMSLASALFMPVEKANMARGTLDEALAPLSIPMRKAASWLRQRATRTQPRPPAASDPALGSMNRDELLGQIDDLRGTVSSLNAQLEALRELQAQLGMLGNARDYCTPFAVVGSDSAQRRSLSLKASSRDNLAAAMPVFGLESARGMLIGRISAAGPAGAQVQLSTDPAFCVQVRFGRYENQPDGTVQFHELHTERSAFARGNGEQFLVSSLPLKDIKAAGIDAGVYAVLADRDWLPIVQSWPIGQVDHVAPQRKAPLFGDIFIRVPNLSQLSRVMVMNRRPPEPGEK